MLFKGEPKYEGKVRNLLVATKYGSPYIAGKGDKIFSKELDARMLAEWKDKFPIYVSAPPVGDRLPAFAPEPPEFSDVAGDIPIDQEPEIILDILKQGDFERIE